MIRTWRLDDSAVTLMLGATADRLAQVVYFGPSLPPDEDLASAFAAIEQDVTGGMLDANPDLSICPEAARTFPGQPGLVLSAEDGTPLTPDLRFRDARGDGSRIDLHYVDEACGLTYRASFVMHRDLGVVEAFARLEATRPVRVHWFAAPVFPAPAASDAVIDFAGRWCGEFRPVRTPWTPGIRLRENRTGRTGHEHFPGAVVVEPGTTRTRGNAQAFHYGWSGGHRMVAEELPDGRRQLQFGHAAHSETRPSTRFDTASLYATCSTAGTNGCAVAFQRLLRDRVVTWPDPARERPVHYNCWESVYFRHDLAELKDLAERVADLGAERFVLDDGWFRGRNDDTTSLSDWTVDREKYPDGLGPLIDHVHGLGMTFGLWFEPEMASPGSMLARKHPDWLLGPADQLLGRHQRVLDMANPEVRDHLFGQLSALLGEYAVDVVKWDHNRVLPQPDAEQARGTWQLLDRLRAAFPALEIESCASGGGRIDAGMLRRTQRVWLSDSNDALERLRIQHEAARFLPAAVTGSHVGPRRCHTSGRVLDMRFRAWVAAQRHFGFEMDPRELTGDEADVLRRVTRWWKANRGWLMRADVLPLESADSGIIAEQQLAADGGRFVCFVGRAAASDAVAPAPLRLTGLEREARYRVDLVNRDDVEALSRGRPALKSGPLTLSGAWLMEQGLKLPFSFPETMWVLEGMRLGADGQGASGEGSEPPV